MRVTLSQTFSMLRSLLYSTCLTFILYIQISVFSGCAKEYSYEGGPLIDTIPQADTTADPVHFPSCDRCGGVTTADLFWNFRYDGSLLCGSITNAVITPERNGFTFFGPSYCSIDSGLIMTVFLDADSLNADKSNIKTNHASLEYYDNTTLSDVFTSSRPSISFIIDSYTHSTGIAKGTFNGTATLKDGTQLTITAGKFAIQFK